MMSTTFELSIIRYWSLNWRMNFSVKNVLKSNKHAPDKTIKEYPVLSVQFLDYQPTRNSFPQQSGILKKISVPILILLDKIVKKKKNRFWMQKLCVFYWCKNKKSTAEVPDCSGNTHLCYWLLNKIFQQMATSSRPHLGFIVLAGRWMGDLKITWEL